MAVATLLILSGSSLAYMALGVAAYFIVVGTAGMHALRGTLQIIDYAHAAARRGGARITYGVVIELLGQGLAKNSRSFAAEGLVLRERELLTGLMDRIGVRAGSAFAADELRRAVLELSRAGRLCFRNSSLGTAEFGYADEVAKFVYDSAMFGTGFTIGRSKDAILARNAIATYHGALGEGADAAAEFALRHVAVPSLRLKRALLHRANRPDRIGATLSVGLASGAIDVIVCS